MTTINKLPRGPKGSGGAGSSIVHIRLAVDTATSIRTEAQALGCQYTDLMRSFIEAGLAAHMAAKADAAALATSAQAQ